MTETLHQWLKERWRFDNHAKYQRYFDEWITNITESQIRYFEKQRLDTLTGAMVQH